MTTKLLVLQNPSLTAVLIAISPSIRPSNKTPSHINFRYPLT
uniref:Uncharacterized protein n=1 Tax=Rhizophora mucronata TaxID=61149 RepID=A0A2P2NMG9_RHIMU